MKISGSGTLSKMNLNDTISSSGSVRITGEVECLGFRSSGSAKGDGNLIVHGDFKSSGSFNLRGALNTDGSARSSGSATIEKELFVKGKLESSGSLRVGNGVEALEGIRFSGSSRVDGGIISEKVIEIDGSTTIRGDIKANDVLFGTNAPFSGKRGVKHPYKVFGKIFAENELELINTFVDGDVRGREVKIGRKTEVTGKVYYIDSIEVDPKTTLAHQPIQISEITEDKITK
ncbi:MAG: polymer-forming cytoskeletal protein [Candidatus Lokiarchaeota archaeon]|nr:polymer-forming cytoskeletal protein [Candidatus Lokiarchaeota archaeon]